MDTSIHKAVKLVALATGSIVVATSGLQVINHHAVRDKLCGGQEVHCESDNGWSALGVQVRDIELPPVLQTSTVLIEVDTSIVRRACDGAWAAALGARMKLDAMRFGELVNVQGACIEVGRKSAHLEVVGTRVGLDACSLRLSPLRMDWNDALQVSLTAHLEPEGVAECAKLLPPSFTTALPQGMGSVRLGLNASYDWPFAKADAPPELSLQKILATMATSQEVRLSSEGGEARLRLATRPAADTARGSPEITLTVDAQGGFRALLPDPLKALITPGHPLQVRWDLGHESGRVHVNDQSIDRVPTQPRPAGRVALAGECAAGSEGPARSLFFVLAGEHGEALAPAQMQAVFDAVDHANAGAGALVAVFVHGWQHSADAKDSYVCSYADLISAVTSMEQSAAQASRRPPREVIGVFFGWPGRPYPSDLVNTVTTFWNRLQTADALGSSQAVLPQLIAGLAARVDSPARDRRADRRSVFIVAGHSMGGRAVFSAVQSGLLPPATASQHAPKPDLVLLINPAFPAEWYHAIHDRESQCQPAALPLLSFSSEVDGVTRQVYPAGQTVTYPYEVPQAAPFLEHIYTAANFPAFVTHRLRMEVLRDDPPDRRGPQTILRGFRRVPAGSKELYDDNPVTVFRQPVAGYPSPADAWYRMNLEPVDSKAGTCTARGSEVIEVDQRILPDHGTIFTPPFMEYLVRAINHGALGTRH